MTDNQVAEANFPASLLPALNSLAARAVEYARSSNELSFASDDEIATSAIVRDGLLKIGLSLELDASFQVWSFVSANYQSGWLDGCFDVESAIGAVRDLCQHIADRTDYAGFSGLG